MRGQGVGRVAVVGSREFPFPGELAAFVEMLPRGTIVLSPSLRELRPVFERVKAHGEEGFDLGPLAEREIADALWFGKAWLEDWPARKARKRRGRTTWT